MTREDIDQRHKSMHDELSDRYYQQHEISKDEFDRLHGELWDSHQRELVAAGLAKPITPDRDLEAELDELKDRVALLER